VIETVPVVYAVWDVASSELLDSKNAHMIHSMASITKLMTVLVVLDSGVNLQEALVVTGREGSSRIRTGMLITRQELIELTLVSSDNLAARTLAERQPGGYEQFINAMNASAYTLSMMNTHYDDATGLISTNVTTAEDLRRLVVSASRYPIYQQAAMKNQTHVQAEFRHKPRTIVGRATNQFAGKLDIRVAKTGFTSHAGRCLTMLYDWQGDQYALVVMGANDPQQRRRIVEQLIAKTTAPYRSNTYHAYKFPSESNTLVFTSIDPNYLTIK
jgi:D-alanyl-D-alanine endopeptidase (penicillin-binding protein 7)